MDDDYGEMFLKVNANPEYIKANFSDVLRDIIRAVASDDPTRAAYSAAEKLKFVLQLVQHCERPIGWMWLIDEGVRELRSELPEDRDDRRYIRAAERGMKYFAESSAVDNAAKGRASRRLDEFLQAISWSEDARRPSGRRS